VNPVAQQSNVGMDMGQTVLSWVPPALMAIAFYAVVRLVLRFVRR
jgi:hypothetical protein